MTTRDARAADTTALQSASGDAVRPAVVVEVAKNGGPVRVRVTGDRREAELCSARLTQIAGYRASAGDRVLVAEDGGDLYVIAVLHAVRTPRAAIPGGTAEARCGTLKLADTDADANADTDVGGRLVVRYAGGEAEIAATEGDLMLATSAGRVVLRAGTDVAIVGARDVVQRAGRRVDLAAGDKHRRDNADGPPEVRVETASTVIKVAEISVIAKATRFVADQATIFARAVATTADHIVTSASDSELDATRLIEKTRDAFRDTEGLAESRAARARTRVRGVYSFFSGRTTMVSREETRIDGKKIHLG